MTTFRASVRGAIIDLLWMAWAEAGVSGWERTGADVAIDIEPLILLTAQIGDADPRLRGEAMDWCIRYGRFVSKVRLKNVRRLGLGTGRAFDEFAATVNAHSSLGWPSLRSAPIARYKPSLRSELDLRRAGVAQLRARAIFGVAARSEILLTLAIERDVPYTATRLAERIHFGRRITVEAANLLVQAGLLVEGEPTPSTVYRLAERDRVRATLGPLPDRWPRGPHVFRVLSAIWDIADAAEGRSDVVRAVEAQKRLVAVDISVVRAGYPHVPTIGPSARGWSDLTDWVDDILARAGAIPGGSAR